MFGPGVMQSRILAKFPFQVSLRQSGYVMLIGPAAPGREPAHPEQPFLHTSIVCVGREVENDHVGIATVRSGLMQRWLGRADRIVQRLNDTPFIGRTERQL